MQTLQLLFLHEFSSCLSRFDVRKSQRGTTRAKIKIRHCCEILQPSSRSFPLLSVRGSECSLSCVPSCRKFFLHLPSHFIQLNFPQTLGKLSGVHLICREQCVSPFTRSKHILKSSKERYLLGQNTTCEFSV